MTPAALERVDAFLAEAKKGIDTGSLARPDIELYIATARRILSEARTARELDLLAQAGQAVMAHLEQLETLRRLCVFGIAHGRMGAEAMEFVELMASRPPLDAAKGLPGFTPAFEWFKANRRRLSRLVSNLQPCPDLL